MVFSSPVFLFLFLPVVLALYFVAPRAARNTVLVTMSLLFYGWAEPRFAIVMVASIVLNYGFGLAIGAAKRYRGALLAAAVAANLGLLIVFKYLAFLTRNLNALLAFTDRPPLPVLAIALPLGISFFTFHGLSYVIDVFRGVTPPQRRPMQMALYISLFPQLIAGPIIRYHEIASQLSRRQTTAAGFANGVRRFVVGLGKKMLIANVVAVPADAMFALPPNELGVAQAWLGAGCYMLQIYFDFSGYSDMAIGLAAMFGFTFPENFAHPYVAESVTDFWRRWHMSLSRWFRDYLYVPLGGNRRGRVRTYANLATVFTLCGFWHGAQWTFLVWGLYHGGFLVLERVGLARVLERCGRPLRHGYLLLVVIVGWVVFRAENLPHAVSHLAAMAGYAPATGGLGDAILSLEPYQIAAIVAGIIGSLPWVSWVRGASARLPSFAVREVMAFAGDAAIVVVLAASVLMMAAGTYNPFIYFRF